MGGGGKERKKNSTTTGTVPTVSYTECSFNLITEATRAQEASFEFSKQYFKDLLAFSDLTGQN